ncbi:MAG TPA: malectin domain-containing carbohydrate-binding protein [Lacunisphaera sp.]|nr:malectin domain-containing carbohydrate-binding protein [Lacunisphaera sp.]
MALCLAIAGSAFAAESPRREISLDAGWRTVADDTDPKKYDGFETSDFDDSSWQKVEVPHNWDDYGGARRLVHGNRHGYAWYRRTFEVAAAEKGQRVFLFFEGVGSYATVWVNGRPAGKHAGGRTTFTLDVTDFVRFGGANLVAVRADHPAGITDLPWVCGGCSTTPGFSEGSQPMGIFRPVSLVVTGDARVEPFGLHVWHDADAKASRAKVHLEAEVRNYGVTRNLAVDIVVWDQQRKRVFAKSVTREMGEGLHRIREDFELKRVKLWSPDSPQVYLVETTVSDGRRVLDIARTDFGIRTIEWPKPDAPLPAPFKLNGKPVFINGTCEYEHLLGASHAFTPEQIAARVAQVKATGFNAFRDAHQPHNLRYQEYWDREGILWWPQFVSQIWYDTPEFRANFKALLRDWVRERRNSPSNVMWGLANESKLPEDFAKECVAIIRELDPTAVNQRIITTCNGGKGTDWNVPQNWTGTYGGDPATYAEDLKKQRLVGEYGAWRSLGLHSEGGYVADGPRSEDRADAIFATKIRAAETLRGHVPGHFHWLFATHDNPGRTIGSKLQQGSDGWAELDRIGPANNKGLLTLWGEPTDAFYLFRASYVPAATDPMVYIVSHTWPDRWKKPGRKSGLLVYSNCEEVELFNDAGGRESLGVRQQGGPGVPFRWDDMDIRYNVLQAEGRVGGKVVAQDAIMLAGLPAAPHVLELSGQMINLTAPASTYHYLYRINCGGPDYTDVNGNRWLADRDLGPVGGWGSRSWAADYPDAPSRFGSQRVSSEIVRGTDDQALFQSYRYGRDKLRYEFPVPPGDYRIELYFAEPWFGGGGGNCEHWRLFDVAVNGETKLRALDLWKEAGFAGAVKKVITGRAKDGRLAISFPRVPSYQAVISAIAIASTDRGAGVPAEALVPGGPTPVQPGTAPATRAQPSPGEGTVYPLAAARREGASVTWPVQLGLGGTHDLSVSYSSPTPAVVELQVYAADGTLMSSRRIDLALGAVGTVDLFNVGMNAGDYTVTLTILSGTPEIVSLLVK